MSERLDKIISTLQKNKTRILSADVLYLIRTAKEIFLSEPTVLDLPPPINICGDIHGQFKDLLRLFEMSPPIPESNYIFLGDYVDRGPQSLEVICYLLALKIKYPTNIYLLRGNHECREMTELYGFATECTQKQSRTTYIEFCHLFNTLPLAAVVAKRIFCVHGGLSPELSSLDKIRAIKRPSIIPETGLMADILWSDPDPAVRDWGNSERGVTYVWGLAPAKKFLEANHFNILVRAHQLAQEGIDFPFSPDRSVITVFSAPNYAGEFRNRGAFLRVDEKLVVTNAVLQAESESSSRRVLSSEPRRTRTPISPTRTVPNRIQVSNSRTSPLRTSGSRPKSASQKRPFR